MLGDEEEPEEVMDEESEEDPEEDPEEVYEESDEVPEKAIDGETEEDPEEEVESDEEDQSVDNSHLSYAKSGSIGSQDVVNELNEGRDEAKGMIVVEERFKPIPKSVTPTINCHNDTIGSSTPEACDSGKANVGSASKQQELGGRYGKQRQSRWDLEQEEETPQIDASSKKRKTRWDNNDSKRGLHDPSDFISFLESSTDPHILSLRGKLMKINKRLQRAKVSVEKQERLINQRKNIISDLAKINLPSESPPAKPKPTFVKKLLIPEKEYPTYNFIGLILGPKGNTQKKMQEETGAKIYLRGKGSGEPGPSEDEDLHVRVEAYDQKVLDSAVSMIQKLLIPVADGYNDHKRAQMAELAILRGTYNICDFCKEQGHRRYACPLQESTFKAVCDLCGSFGHSTSNCNASRTPGTLQIDPANLYIGYLSQAIDENRLKELFLPFGKIVSVAVIKDHTTSLSKGYGFVKFENPSDASAAITYMNGYKMDGKMLAVRVAGQRPVLARSNPDLVPIHFSHTGVRSSIPNQSASFFGPLVSMLPEAPFSNLNSESSSIPPSSSYGNIAVKTEDPYATSSVSDPNVTSNFSSDFDFCDKIPDPLANSVSKFPGDPDYVSNSVSKFPGHPDYMDSQFKSYFTTPLMNDETPYQMPEADKKFSFWSASRFP